MAEVIRYVDPDASGTGDGESWANAYTSLSAWNTGEQTDLVTDGNWHHVYCRSSSGTADTTALRIDDWTTGVANYILIEAADGDQAIKSSYDTSRYRIEGSNAIAIRIDEDYVRILGVQIKATAVDTNAISGLYVTGQGVSNDIRVNDCRIVIAQSGTSVDGHGVYTGTGNTSITIINTLITGTPTYGMYLRYAGGAIYNCIVYGGVSGGVRFRDAIGIIKNSAIFNTANDYVSSGLGDTVDYCATDDADGTNAVAASGSDWTNEFTAPSTGNFTLLKDGNCYHGGIYDASAPTIDMDGDSYNNPPSIGVDEYKAFSVPIAMNFYRGLR